MLLQNLDILLCDTFPEKFVFLPSGKYLVVNTIDINLCTYSIANLHRYGSLDSDLAKILRKMILQELQDEQALEGTWLQTLEELISKMDIKFTISSKDIP